MKTPLRFSAVVAIMIVSLSPEMRGVPSPGSPPPARFEWIFDLHPDLEGTPRSDVSLRVNGKTVRLASHVTAQFTTVERPDYGAHAVPASALTACSGWWAGQGEEMYVVRRGGAWKVYARELDEGTPCPAYRLRKSVSFRKN